MKRDRLIPVEKSKKVIYLDPRGRGVDQKHYGAMALYVLAVCRLWQLFFPDLGCDRRVLCCVGLDTDS